MCTGVEEKKVEFSLFRNGKRHAAEVFFCCFGRTLIARKIRFLSFLPLHIPGNRRYSVCRRRNLRIEIAPNEVEFALQVLTEPLTFRVGNLSDPAILQESENAADRCKEE